MNDYILRLKFTQIELPPNIRQESKDFPRARIRTSTPKCKDTSFDFKSTSRPSSPKANPTRLALKRQEPKPQQKNHPVPSPNSLQIKLNTINAFNFPSGPKYTAISQDLTDYSLFPINSVLRNTVHSKYRVRRPARTLNIPSPTFKIS